LLTIKLFNGTTRKYNYSAWLFNRTTIQNGDTYGEYSEYLMTSHFSNCL
jgi:hypothetical protein